MSTVRELHDQAMQYGHLAITARQKGDMDSAVSLARQAYQLEYQAALLVPDGEASEPTRSILYRSASSFALQCGDYEAASRMAGIGLSGYPPPKIQHDLIALLEQVKNASVRTDDRTETETNGFRLPIYLEPDIDAYISRLAHKKGTRADTLLNTWIRHNIGVIETVQ